MDTNSASPKFQRFRRALLSQVGYLHDRSDLSCGVLCMSNLPFIFFFFFFFFSFFFFVFTFSLRRTTDHGFKFTALGERFISFEVTYKVLVFKPFRNEVFDGIVIDVMDVGGIDVEDSMYVLSGVLFIGLHFGSKED